MTLKKILKNEKTYLIILAALLVITFFDLVRMLLFSEQKNLGSFILGHILSIIFAILLIAQLAWLRKTARTSSAPIAQRQIKKNDSNNAIISFICALVPLFVMLYCLITILISPGNKNDNGAATAWIFVIYAITIGLPIFFLWLVCGIIGLKTSKRKLALASLILKPVGMVIIWVLGYILTN